MVDRCIICDSKEFLDVFHIKKVPICPNSPIEKGEFSKELFGELRVVMCKNCSHIFNKEFNPKIIKEMYFKNYSSGLPLTKPVIDDYKLVLSNGIELKNIEHKKIIEIGAGDFTFSKLMLTKGAFNVLAFEPSDLFKCDEPRIFHIKDYFSKYLIPNDFKDFDVVVIRHTLEHLSDPLRILKDIKESMKRFSLLYIEVPNINDILEKSRIYDFFYEHISYFSPEILKSILINLGFEILKESYFMDGQHFGLLCRKVNDEKPLVFDKSLFLNKSLSIVNLNDGLSKFKSDLLKILKRHKKKAIYGAGNHGIGTTILLRLDDKEINFFIDVNPLKENKYSPGSHIIIKTPEKGMMDELDAIIIIASLHQNSIHKDLREKYKFKGKIYGTYPFVSELK